MDSQAQVREKSEKASRCHVLSGVSLSAGFSLLLLAGCAELSDLTGTSQASSQGSNQPPKIQGSGAQAEPHGSTKTEAGRTKSLRGPREGAESPVGAEEKAASKPPEPSSASAGAGSQAIGGDSQIGKDLPKKKQKPRTTTSENKASTKPQPQEQPAQPSTDIFPPPFAPPPVSKPAPIGGSGG